MPGQIQVVNKRSTNDKRVTDGEYIGRPSVFGNPYTHLESDTLAKYHVATRAEAVEAYREWAQQQYVENEFFRISLDDLVKKYIHGDDVILVCYCAPLPCHGDILKEMIYWLAELQIVEV